MQVVKQTWFARRTLGLTADCQVALASSVADAMGWVNDARKELEAGRSVRVRPFGGSMRGRIESGQPVTLAPVAPAEVAVGDVVFVSWRGNYLLHLVKEVREGEFLIGNNLGKVNGWVPASAVVGNVIAIGEEDPKGSGE